MSLDGWRDWLGLAARIGATVAAGAGLGGLSVHQWDQRAPERAERALAELQLEANERQAMRERCDRQLAQTQAECRHLVERCEALVTGRE